MIDHEAAKRLAIAIWTHAQYAYTEGSSEAIVSRAYLDLAAQLEASKKVDHAAVSAMAEILKKTESELEAARKDAIEQSVLLHAALSVMEEWDGGLDQQDGKEYENACKDWNDCLSALREWKVMTDAAMRVDNEQKEA